MKKDIAWGAAIGVVASIATVVLLLGAMVLLARYQPDRLDALVTRVLSDSSSNVEGDGSYESSVIATVANANPAVVAITVSKNMPVYERYYNSNPFNFFFGVPQIRQNGTELQEIGGGSGFLVSADGYIVTNRHVVSDETAQYTVLTNDGETYDATVVARDSVLDIAVIKIEGENFAYLSFGDSASLQVGQSVIAIGNALAEFRNTVSVGVVSGLSRSIVASDPRGETESLDELIQTDAAINSGNSGGPLLNLHGDVVGVNVAIASGAQNVGFALSGNSVKNIIESVEETGKIVHPYIGVRYIPVTATLQKQNGLSVDYGVLVQRGEHREDLAVIPGSPADKAGISENDIILVADGVKLTFEHQLASVLQNKNVGDSIPLKVLSKGKEKDITVTLEAMP